MRAIPIALLLVLGLSSWPWIAPHSPPLEAGTVQRMDWAELTQSCEQALEGRVIAVHSRPTARGSIETQVRMQVSRRHYGGSGVEQIFRIPGGVLADGRGLLVPGMPRFLVGQELLLFLSAESTAGWRVPVGLAQGRWLIQRDAQGKKFLTRELVDVDAEGTGAKTRVDYESALLECTRLWEQRRAREARR